MIENLKKLLNTRSVEFFSIAAILWFLPLLTLALFGLVFLLQAGWLLWFSAGLLVLGLTSRVVSHMLSRQRQVSDVQVEHLAPRRDWSALDIGVWDKCIANIKVEKLVETPWESLPTAMLDQFVFVARTYHGNDGDVEYKFSLPELLLMLETWSREYRAKVVENVPLVQEVNISTLMNLSRKAEKTQKIYQYVGPLLKTLRIGINPATGIIGVIASQFAAKAFGDLSVHMQVNMKNILFEQVTHVAIDLYSGRFKISEEELLAFRHAEDSPDLEKILPLSVAIIGQINAGKSSLINLLKKQCVAEVDLLPATAGFHYHHMQLASDLEVYLIDTPGLDGKEDTSKAILEIATHVDLIVWVSQATQPAKALDKQFIDKWNAYFETNLRRRKPPILLVTTHNDMLQPANDWYPPYDLTDLDNEKVKSMIDALDYTHEAIGLPKQCLAVPVSLLPDEDGYNIDTLNGLLLSISDQARAAQLNRQRLDADGRASVVSKGLRQLAGLVKSVIKVALK